MVLRLSLLVSVLVCVGATFPERIWESCVTNQTKIRANTALQQKSIAVSSERFCVALTIVNDWADLLCYDGGTCNLWGFDALSVGETEVNKTGACKMTAFLKRCVNPSQPTARRLFVGEGSFEKTCSNGYKYTCYDDGVVRLNDTARVKMTACGEHGFISTSLGCLLIVTTRLTYSAARQNCMDFGADLFYPNAAQDVTQLSSILAAYASSGDFWFGATKFTGSFTWLSGRKVESIEISGFSAGSLELFGKGKADNHYKLSDDDCEATLASLCLATTF
ncbi:uncharacterized protein LOC125177921 [Hyalella azteca]|uniref:Uncharacterized protein LOC125177921 n=1 Tax=Hyalella azteca TaxID=294128 RepID=A0A979FIN8_HYAAZ|nr:uncharacterized protein LOC125177921 [Hyalella azteca]